MAEVVVGIAASHAPNLAVPSLMQGVKEEQYGTVKAGFAEARTLLELARPDAIVIFSTDHFDRRFYDNFPTPTREGGQLSLKQRSKWSAEKNTIAFGVGCS